jgi:Arc/MetJ-type ribon-helix-helix transcriptional regulator
MKDEEIEVPDDLLKGVDKVVEGGGYKDREDLVQDAIRRFLEERQQSVQMEAHSMKSLGITKQVPKQHLIRIKVSEKRIQKLAAWLKRRDVVRVNINISGRDVYLENETIHNKWVRKMIREGHVVEIEEKRPQER